MWGKIIISMYRLWLNGLYGLYGPRCPLFSKRPINLISLSLSHVTVSEAVICIDIILMATICLIYTCGDYICIFITRNNKGIMFSPCVFVSLLVCVNVCPNDLTMKNWCHTMQCYNLQVSVPCMICALNSVITVHANNLTSKVLGYLHAHYWLQNNSNALKIFSLFMISNSIFTPPASTKLKEVYTGFPCLSVRLSICPSVDRIMSALYRQQYSSDPFHISTSYQATSEGVSHAMFVSKWKKLEILANSLNL